MKKRNKKYIITNEYACKYLFFRKTIAFIVVVILMEVIVIESMWGVLYANTKKTPEWVEGSVHINTTTATATISASTNSGVAVGGSGGFALTLAEASQLYNT